jgi:hypothetical protein
MSQIKIRKIHKWLGLIASVYVLLAVSSGIIHIIMANFFTPPPPVMPEGLVNVEQAKMPIAKIIEKLPKDFGKVKAINFRTIEGKLYYQIFSDKPTKPVYIDAISAKIIDGLDEVYAKEIAEKYLKTKVENTDYLTAFNNEYLNIFRILPAYKFKANNDLSEKVYVSTKTGSVTLYLNKYRELSQKSFSYLHKFQFIENKLIRDILLGLAALSVLTVAIMGVIIFAKSVKK